MVSATSNRRAGKSSKAMESAVVAAIAPSSTPPVVTAAPDKVASTPPVAPPQHPVIVAYNALRTLGLTFGKNTDNLRAVEFVAVAAMARRQLGKTLAPDALLGRALLALSHIATIEKNANDCLPNAIGGANPDHIRIGEIFGTLLGFNEDARKARSAAIAAYVGNLR